MFSFLGLQLQRKLTWWCDDVKTVTLPSRFIRFASFHDLFSCQIMAVTHISINPADVLLSRSMSESTSVRDSNVIKSHTSILIFEPIENSTSIWAARAEKKWPFFLSVFQILSTWACEHDGIRIILLLWQYRRIPKREAYCCINTSIAFKSLGRVSN